MKKLHTEQELIESQKTQIVGITKLIEGGKVSLSDFEDIIPGFWLIQDVADLRPTYASKAYSEMAGYSQQEIVQWSGEELVQKIVSNESVEVIKSKATSLLDANKHKVTSYFQKARRDKAEAFSWYFSNKKLIGNSNQTLLVLHSIDELGSFSKKLQNLLEDNYFIKQNYKQFASLSYHEAEVLKLIAKGVKRNEIAEVLNISVFTYDTHRRNIRAKLEAKSFKDLLKYAEAFDLI